MPATVTARETAAPGAPARPRVEDHLGLLRYWAQRLARPGVEFEDLVQEGYFGLAKAVDRYDPGRGVTFATYASFWIRQSMQRGSAALTAGPVTVPPDAQTAGRQVQAAIELLVGRGRPVDVGAVAATSGLPTRVVERSLATPRRATAPLEDLGEVAGEVAEVVSDLRLDVARALEGLGGAREHLVRHRYGIGAEPHKVAEVCRALGLSTAEYRGRHAEALALLAGSLDGHQP